MLRLRVAAAARANGGAGLAPLDQELNQLLNSILGAAGLEPSPAEEEEASDEALGRGSPSAAPQQQPQPPRPLLGSPTVAPLSAAAAPHRIPAGERALYGELPPDCAFLRPGQQFEGRQRVAAYHGINPKHETCECGGCWVGWLVGWLPPCHLPHACRTGRGGEH